MQIDMRRKTLARLARIEGQVRGLARMIEDDRYCVDVVIQVSAVRAALKKVEEAVLRDHVAHCVADAVASGDEGDRKQKLDELMDLFGRVGR
ncbi:MAG: metal-sensitive transcriptional regulator [Caulobacteraceae bacterium]